MADLVRDHIGLGELAGVAVQTTTELFLQIVEKRGDEVNALIARAIERPHGRLCDGQGVGSEQEKRRSFGGW